MTDDLLQRLARVERRQKFLVVISLLALSLTIILAFGVYQLRRRKDLVQQSGRITADLIEAKRVVAGSVSVVASAGKNGASIGASDDGWVSLSFTDLAGYDSGGFLLTPSGKLSLDFFRKRGVRLRVGVVDSPTGSGEEFSLQLKNAQNEVIWHPGVANPY